MGYNEEWSTMPEFMGRICRPLQNLSHPVFGTIAGITFGTLTCCGIIFVLLCTRKQRRIKSLVHSKLLEDSFEHIEFQRQINELRPKAHLFLDIMNDSRRQIRKMHLNGDSTGESAYRPIVSDLAKILILLNRPPELIAMPPSDWNRLYIWAKRVLERYKPQMSLYSSSSNSNLATTDYRLTNCQHNTFKSNTLNPSNASCLNGIQMQSFGSSLISLQESDSSFSSGLVDSSKNRLSLSKSFWMEDEFFKLGMRPQDEITTEL